MSLISQSLLITSMSSQPKKIYVAVVGVGLVGSEFINQLVALPANSAFHLVSLTSSSRTVFTKESPIQAQWKSILSSSSQRPDLQVLTKQLASLVSPTEQVALIDNTSSEDVAAMYPAWLQAGIHVITPNKKACSGESSLYDKIISASQQSGARFLNESTVGAGLPVISTLKDLVATGDKVREGTKSAMRTNHPYEQVLKIEGVFSGTMSYIFNEFSTGKEDGPSFSSVVSVAREKGYTVCSLSRLHNAIYI